MSLPRFNNNTVGILAGILSAAGYGVTSSLVHALADSIPAAEVTFVRAVVGLLILLPFVGSRLGTLVEKGSFSVWVRAVAGAVSILCFAWNLQHTDVGTANILFNFSLVLVLIADYASGEVAFTFGTAGCIVLALAGTLIYWYGHEVSITNGVLTVGLVGAIAASIAYAALKRTARSMDPWLINWVVCLTSIPVSFVGRSGSWVAPSTTSCIILAIIAFGNLIVQYLLNVSFAKLPLSVATALVPSCIVWSVLGAAAIQSIAPRGNAFWGATTYAVGVALLIADSKKLKMKKEPLALGDHES